MSAVTWQRLEGGLVLAAALGGLWLGGLGGWSWWAAMLWFFAPDLAFAGYLGGPRLGALVYNGVHIYGFGALVLSAALAAGSPALAAIGIFWIGHAGFDRLLGYGLKLPTGFQDTHLGRIGRQG